MSNYKDRQYDFLVFDTNSIAHACAYAPNLNRLGVDSARHGHWLLTGAILGTINTVSSALIAHPEAVPVLLWDGHSAWRREVLPEYKEGRKADPKSEDPKIRDKAELQRQIKLQSPLIRLFFDALGVTQVVAPDQEADDLGGLAARNVRPGQQICLQTADTDWLQSIRPGVDWYRAALNRFYCYEDTVHPDIGMEVDGVVFNDPRTYIEVKALAGDASDSIPGCPGIGLKTGLKYHHLYGGFEAMWEKVESGEIKPKGKKESVLMTSDSRVVYERNLEIMDFEHSRLDGLDDTLSISNPEPDLLAFQDLCQEFEFTRIGSQFDRYLKNFGQAQERRSDLVRLFDC